MIGLYILGYVLLSILMVFFSFPVYAVQAERTGNLTLDLHWYDLLFMALFWPGWILLFLNFWIIRKIL